MDSLREKQARDITVPLLTAAASGGNFVETTTSSQISNVATADPTATSQKLLLSNVLKNKGYPSRSNRDLYSDAPFEQQRRPEGYGSSAFNERGHRTDRRRLTTYIPERVRMGLNRLIRIGEGPAYGKKTIGQIGSFIYLVNQIFGAGILALPFVLKMSGWLPSLLANLLVCVVAMFGTLMILRSMTMVAGNQNFERRMEYIATVEYFLGRKLRYWTEACFYLSIQSLNVVSIAVVSQSLDHLLLKWLGQTQALVCDPFAGTFSMRTFRSQQSIDDLYSGGGGLVFAVTVGYIINALICIPLSSQNMDENMKIQYISFAFLVTSVVQISLSAATRILSDYQFGFVFSFFRNKTLSNNNIRPLRSLVVTGAKLEHSKQSNFIKPEISDRFQVVSSWIHPPRMFGCYQFNELLSTFIASYSYVNVIPSWGNEMTPGVRVNEAVYLSSIFAALAYYIFGFLLAYAYPSVHTDNILQELLSDENIGDVTRFFIYVFNLLTVLPGILVYSIATRYNLLNSGVASPRGSFFIGCVLPFTFAWLLANDRYFSAVLQWSSLLFSLAVNFVIPLLVYLKACSGQRLASRNPTRHFQTLSSYASRTREGVQTMMSDISLKLREYLHSLPSSELDPEVRQLLRSPIGSSMTYNRQLSDTMRHYDHLPTERHFFDRLLTDSQELFNSRRSTESCFLDSKNDTLFIPRPSTASGASNSMDLGSYLTTSRGTSGPLAPHLETLFSLSDSGVDDPENLSLSIEKLLRTSSDVATASTQQDTDIIHSPRTTVQQNLDNTELACQTNRSLPWDIKETPNSNAWTTTLLTEDENLKLSSHRDFSRSGTPTRFDTAHNSKALSKQVRFGAKGSRRQLPSDDVTQAHSSHGPLLHQSSKKFETEKESSSNIPNLPATYFPNQSNHSDPLTGPAIPFILSTTPYSPTFDSSNKQDFVPSWTRALPKQLRFFPKRRITSLHRRSYSANPSSHASSLRPSFSAEGSPVFTRIHFASSMQSSFLSDDGEAARSLSSPPRRFDYSLRTLSAEGNSNNENTLQQRKPVDLLVAVEAMQTKLSSLPVAYGSGTNTFERSFTSSGHPQSSTTTTLLVGTHQTPSITITPTAEPEPCSVNTLDVPANPLLRLASLELMNCLDFSDNSQDTPFDPNVSSTVTNRALSPRRRRSWPSKNENNLPQQLQRATTNDTYFEAAHHIPAPVRGTSNDIGIDRAVSTVIFYDNDTPYNIIQNDRIRNNNNNNNVITSAKQDECRVSHSVTRKKPSYSVDFNSTTTLHRLPTNLFNECVVYHDYDWKDHEVPFLNDASTPWRSESCATAQHSSFGLLGGDYEKANSLLMLPSSTGSFPYERATSGGNRRHHRLLKKSFGLLLPPPVSIKELPLEPPVELMSPAVRGAEDAYECDEEPSTGDLKPIRIHVFPEGVLRTYHLITTKVLIYLLVAFCILSAGSQLIVNILQAWGKLTLPSGDCTL